MKKQKWSVQVDSMANPVLVEADYFNTNTESSESAYRGIGTTFYIIEERYEEVSPDSDLGKNYESWFKQNLTRWSSGERVIRVEKLYRKIEIHRMVANFAHVLSILAVE